jgi:hypothetical protein
MNALVVRTLGAELLAVRIDLDRSGTAAPS